MDRRILPAVPRALNPGVLVSELYNKHADVPCLVVGGGPSAPAQFEALGQKRVAHMLVISANGHAYSLGLRPDYLFCKDHIHTERKVPMEGLVRGNGVPIVTTHYWADYRAAHWPMQGNSGQLAIALAALMGCAPIVPIGIDCFLGATYFHNPDAGNISRGRSADYWKSRMERMKLRLAGAMIRPLGGPLAHTFPRYKPYEDLDPQRRIPACFDPHRDMPTRHVRALKPFIFPQDKRAEVPVGTVIPVSEAERALFVRQGVAETVGREP